MERDKQLEKHNVTESLKDSENVVELVQFNVAIPKSTKIEFMKYCLENEMNVKQAADIALLEFLKTRKD